MKFTLRFFKKAGAFLMVLGVILLCSFGKNNWQQNYEVLVRCFGALVFIIGGTALVYANEKENHNQDQKPDNTY